MQAQRFHKLKTHREAGVETGRRVLEDHGNVFADELAPLAIGQAEQVLGIELQVLSTHAARIGDEPHQRHHADALARARLADDPQYLSRLHLQANAFHCVHHSVLRGELHVELTNFK